MFKNSKPLYNLRINVEEWSDVLCQAFPRLTKELTRLQDLYEGYFHLLSNNRLIRGRVEGLLTHEVEMGRDRKLYLPDDMPLYLVEKERRAYLSVIPHIVA